MAAHPAEEEEGDGHEGGGNAGGKGFGLPTLVEEMVEEHQTGPEQADETHQGADRHEDGAEDRAFALAGKSLGAVRESAHGVMNFPAN